MGQDQGQAQQISVEDALAAFRKRCADLSDTNVLLEARAAGLQRRITELEAEVGDLRRQAELPQPGPVSS